MSEAITSPEALAPQGVSPLAEADPASLNELIQQRIDDIFNKKPPYSDDELRVIVDYQRKNRHRFMVESQAKEAKGPRQARSVAPKAAPKSVAEALKENEDIL